MPATIKQCLVALYENPMLGFHSADRDWCEKMARSTILECEWSPRQKHLAYTTLAKYRAQLGTLGIDYKEVVAPPAIDEPKITQEVRKIVQTANRRVLFIKSGVYGLLSPYDPQLVTAIKTLPNRIRGWIPEKKHWEVNLTRGSDGKALAEFNTLLDTWKFQMSEEVKADLQLQFAKAITKEHEQKQAFEQSFATDADFKVEGLGLTLRGFQSAGVKYAVEKERCFIADEQGLGKTLQALAVLQHKASFPALIVCKAALRKNWVKEVRQCLPDRKVTLEPGDMEYRVMQILVISYEGLVKWYEKLEEYEWQAIILDESQMIKHNKAKRTQACKDIAKVSKARIRLCLTGTPIDNCPYEYAPQLTFLDRMKDLGGSEFFYDRFCGRDTQGAQNLPELNALLRKNCYIRRLKKDVLKELPPKQRSYVQLEVDNMKEYKRAEADIIAYLRGEVARNPAAFEVDPDALIDGESVAAKQDHVARKAGAAEHLVRINHLKQLAMKGMLEGAKAWVEEFIESGEKLVVFCHHVEAQRQVWQMFRDVAVWTGNPAGPQAAVESFQKDPKIKIIVCSLSRDNAGHTLTAASNVVFFELGWTPTIHAQAEDRCHRIGQYDSVTAWYLIALGTIYEKIIALIEEKRKIVDAATDGTATLPSKSNIMRDLVRQLAA